MLSWPVTVVDCPFHCHSVAELHHGGEERRHSSPKSVVAKRLWEVPVNTRIPSKVLVPLTLTFDKLCALYVYVTFVENKRLDDMLIMFEGEFGNTNDISKEIFDIDVRRPYNRDQRYGSALEKLVRQFNVKKQGLELLIRMVNENNETAYLKRMENSFVELIRILYEVGHNKEATEYRRQVLADMWPIITTYFAAVAKDEVAVRNRLNRQHDIFTLDGYDWLMRQAGLKPRQVENEHERFEHLFEKANVRDERAQQRAHEVKPEHVFDLKRFDGNGTVTGHLIISDDKRIASYYLEKHQEIHLLIVKRRSGHHAIFVRGRQLLGDLVEVLNEREPEKWYLFKPDERPILFNGGSSRYAEPSVIAPLELIKIVQEHYLHMTRDQLRNMTS